MTAVFIAFAVVIATALALIAYLVVKLLGRSERSEAAAAQVAEIRGQLGDAKLEIERKGLELGKATAALTTERVRADALESYVATQALETRPNVDLAADDVAGRLFRLSRDLAVAAAEAHPRSPVRAGGEIAVPADPPAEVVHRAGLDDLQQPE